MTRLRTDVTSERWNIATAVFIIFFRDRPNTCFDIVFFCSDLFDGATVSEIPMPPSSRKKKIGKLQTDRETTTIQWVYADLK
jgi:hypothetical protein